MRIMTKKGLFSKETKNGLVVLSRDESGMFILNNTALIIWKACARKSTIDEILSNVSSECEMREEDLRGFKKECMAIVKKNPELFEILDI